MMDAMQDESGTVIVSDEWPEGDPDEGFGVCINFDICKSNVSLDSGIHQFCKECYHKWASAWFVKRDDVQ